MTMNLGFGFDAEVNYRQERLRADFGRTHDTNKPHGWQRRWWQRRPAAAVAGHRTPTAVAAHRTTTVAGTQLAGADTVNAKTAEVVPVAMESLVVGGRASTASSPKDRAHAA